MNINTYLYYSTSHEIPFCGASLISNQKAFSYPITVVQYCISEHVVFGRSVLHRASPVLPKICGVFSPPAGSIALSCTMKAGNTEKSPGVLELDFSVSYSRCVVSITAGPFHAVMVGNQRHWP